MDPIYNGLKSLVDSAYNGGMSLFLTLFVGAVVSFLVWGVNRLLGDYLIKKVTDIYHKIIKSSSSLDPQTIHIMTEINSEVSALRVEMGGARCLVVELHNGEVFASKNHIWKWSASYEKVKAGVSLVGKDWQNVLASLVWDDFTTILFDEGRRNLPPGIEHIDRNAQNCKGGCQFPRGCFLVKTDDMSVDGGHMRTMLEQCGTTHMLVAPIYTFEGQPLGFVAIHYQEGGFQNYFNDQDFDPCRLCRYASHIAMVWEGNLDTKRKMLQYQKNLWENE